MFVLAAFVLVFGILTLVGGVAMAVEARDLPEFIVGAISAVAGLVLVATGIGTLI